MVMAEEPLHLMRVPLRAERLVALAKRRHISIRNLDDGYLAHCLLTELWQSHAPAPFVLRGGARSLDVWGYARSDAPTLVEHARAFGDPGIVQAIDDLNAISSRPMPIFERGRRVGFLLRACPVARLANVGNGHHAGAEVDVFLAKSLSAASNGSVTREHVYGQWLNERLADTGTCGARIDQVRIAALSRARLVRRTQGDDRRAKTLERPDVRFEGDLIVEDGETFLSFLARGVGRHKAFGFGAMMIVPPNTTYPTA